MEQAATLNYPCAVYNKRMLSEWFPLRSTPAANASIMCKNHGCIDMDIEYERGQGMDKLSSFELTELILHWARPMIACGAPVLLPRRQCM
jgi:hypothetical protein